MVQRVGTADARTEGRLGRLRVGPRRESDVEGGTWVFGGWWNVVGETDAFVLFCFFFPKQCGHTRGSYGRGKAADA